MKLLKISGVVIGALLGIFILGSWFLPSTTHLERSIIIKARPSIIFHEVNNPRNYKKWSPWANLDPKMTYTFSGPKEGVKAKMSWYSDHEDVGTGTQRIVESVKNELVVTKLEYGGFEGEFQASIMLEPQGDETKVTWTYEADMEDNVLARVFGLFMDDMLGPFYEEGLINLKRVVESKPIDSISIEEVVLEPKTFLGMGQYVLWEDFSSIIPLMDSYDSTIRTYMTEQGLEPTGQPFARYSDYEAYSGVHLTYGIPMAQDWEVSHEQINLYKTVQRMAVKTVYTGSYFTMDPTYDMMEIYITEHGHKMLDESIQVFVRSHREEADTAKWETNIYIPWE